MASTTIAQILASFAESTDDPFAVLALDCLDDDYDLITDLGWNPAF